MGYPIQLAWTPFDPWHLLVLGAIALLLFGKRLPEVGRSLGKGISEFKKGLQDVKEEIGKDTEEDQPPRQKLRAPADESADYELEEGETQPREQVKETTETPNDTGGGG